MQRPWDHPLQGPLMVCFALHLRGEPIGHLSLCPVLDEQLDDCKYREHIDELGEDLLAHMACDGTANHHGDDD